jgi:hypothetical protein
LLISMFCVFLVSVSLFFFFSSDMFPTTPLGKLVGTLTMVCGLLVIALPISVIGTNFLVCYEQLDAKKRKQRAADELAEKEKQEELETEKERKRERKRFNAKARKLLKKTKWGKESKWGSTGHLSGGGGGGDVDQEGGPGGGGGGGMKTFALMKSMSVRLSVRRSGVVARRASSQHDLFNRSQSAEDGETSLSQQRTRTAADTDTGTAAANRSQSAEATVSLSRVSPPGSPTATATATATKTTTVTAAGAATSSTNTATADTAQQPQGEPKGNPHASLLSFVDPKKRNSIAAPLSFSTNPESSSSSAGGGGPLFPPNNGPYGAAGLSFDSLRKKTAATKDPNSTGHHSLVALKQKARLMPSFMYDASSALYYAMQPNVPTGIHQLDMKARLMESLFGINRRAPAAAAAHHHPSPFSSSSSSVPASPAAANAQNHPPSLASLRQTADLAAADGAQQTPLSSSSSSSEGGVVDSGLRLNGLSEEELKAKYKVLMQKGQALLEIVQGFHARGKSDAHTVVNVAREVGDLVKKVVLLKEREKASVRLVGHQVDVALQVILAWLSRDPGTSFGGGGGSGEVAAGAAEHDHDVGDGHGGADDGDEGSGPAEESKLEAEDERRVRLAAFSFSVAALEATKAPFRSAFAPPPIAAAQSLFVARGAVLASSSTAAAASTPGGGGGGGAAAAASLASASASSPSTTSTIHPVSDSPHTPHHQPSVSGQRLETVTSADEPGKSSLDGNSFEGSSLPLSSSPSGSSSSSSSSSSDCSSTNTNTQGPPLTPLHGSGRLDVTFEPLSASVHAPTSSSTQAPLPAAAGSAELREDGTVISQRTLGPESIGDSRCRGSSHQAGGVFVVVEVTAAERGV